MPFSHSIMEPTIRMLDLNDDILCDILRRVAATEDGDDCGADGFLPLLKVGAGRVNLDSFALLQTSGTCKRFRQVVCTTLPTRYIFCAFLRVYLFHCECGSEIVDAQHPRCLQTGGTPEVQNRS